MIKRLLATACAAVMLITLAACGDKSDQKDEASESGSQKAATLSVEKTFEKEFEAAKSFDIDALAEVEYFINFGNGVDKEKYIEQSKASLAQLGEGELDKYIEAQKDLTYIITDQTELKDDALKKRIKELSASYRDTDKIEEIINITYRIEGGELTTAEVEKTAEMIKVDGQWYCNMGDRAMAEQ